MCTVQVNGSMNSWMIILLSSLSLIKPIINVWTVDSIVSILAIYFDCVHRLLSLNLIVLWCFRLDGIILLLITDLTRHNESYLVNHCANQQCQGPCSSSDFSAQQSTELLPAATIMSSSHDPNETSNLPTHVLPARRTSDRAVNV